MRNAKFPLHISFQFYNEQNSAQKLLPPLILGSLNLFALCEIYRSSTKTTKTTTKEKEPKNTKVNTHSITFTVNKKKWDKKRMKWIRKNNNPKYNIVHTNGIILKREKTSEKWLRKWSVFCWECAREAHLFYACCIDFSVNLLFPTKNRTPTDDYDDHDDDDVPAAERKTSIFSLFSLWLSLSSHLLYQSVVPSS